MVVGVSEPSTFINKCTGAEFLQSKGVSIIYLDEFKGMRINYQFNS